MGRRDRRRHAEPEVHQRVRRVVRRACQACPGDRPGRAADDDAPPRRARSTIAAGAGPVDVGSVVRIPFGHQKLDGVVVGARGDERGAATRSSSRRPRCASDSIPRDLVELALWMADGVLLDARRARCRSCCRRRAGRGPRCGRAPAGPLDGRAAHRRASARCWRGCPRPAGADLPALRRLEARGLVTIARARAPARAAARDPPADRPVGAHAPSRQAALAAIEARRRRASCFMG